MKTALERLPKSRIRLSVPASQEAVQKAVDAAYEALNAQVEIKGFRKGQAPKSKVFESVGLARLRETVLERLLPTIYFEAIQKAKVVPVEGPQVKIDSDAWEKGLPEGKATDGLSFTAEVDILPQVKLTGDYKKIRIAKKKEGQEVADDEVENVLTHVRRQHAQFKEIDRAVKNGDRIEIEFEGKVVGVIRPEFSSKNFPLILGNQAMQPGFEEKLLGMKKGDTKSFRHPFQLKKDAGEEEVDFTVTLLKAEEVLLPALDEAFAKKMGHDSLLALRGAVRASLKQNKQDRERRGMEQEVADKLVNSANLEVPQSLIHQEIHRIMDTLKAQATSYGMPWEQYLVQIKKNEADLHNDLKEQAEKTVKFGLILGHIMSHEKIDPKAEHAGRQAMDRLLEYATKK